MLVSHDAEQYDKGRFIGHNILYYVIIIKPYKQHKESREGNNYVWIN